MMGDETDGYLAWQRSVGMGEDEGKHQARLPDIPLAGDVVEAIAKRFGADKLAQWWEEQTGLPCGCEERKEKLNRATEQLLKWMEKW